MNPPASNFTYDVDAFVYHPDRSMAGVFYLDRDTNPTFNYFRPYPGLNLPPPYFFDIPFPFSIRSSSHGLLLCYDLYNSAYHVFNPFINTPASYRRIPTPPREHEFNTPAVLDVTITNSGGVPFFDIICAVEEELGRYIFDSYSSNEDTWTADTRVLTIKPRSIMANTGIGTGKGSAVWLTNKPHELVMYSIHSRWRMFKAPTRLPKNATLQLGRMNEDDIALVATGVLSEVRVFVGLSSWKEFVVYMDKGGAVQLMRFMTDVPLFTTDRIMRLWCSCDGLIYSMPQWIQVPPSISDCVPYVTSRCVADQFKKVDYGDDDEDEDDEDEDDEDEYGEDEDGEDEYGEDKDDGDEDGKNKAHGDEDDKEKDVEMKIDDGHELMTFF